LINALILTLNNIKGINTGLRKNGGFKKRAMDIRNVIIKEYHLE
jgi:hypothetical protein